MDIEEKKNENECFVLKYNELINIQTEFQYHIYKIYIQNSDVFGTNDWFKIKSETIVLEDYTSRFIDSLQMKDNKTICIYKPMYIDEKYHSEITESEYILRINDRNEKIKEIKGKKK
eukprot:64820_1